jgi:hypothetical protein
MMRLPFALAGAGIGAAAGVYALVLRPLQQRWGIDPDTTVRTLPGDEVIPDPTGTETRVIDIQAPAELVYPWLVQMGFGRAGWYSYDTMDTDRPSATRIDPELQSLAVGDILPTHPGGGFRVASMKPNRSLVLSIDTQLVEEQARAAREAAGDRPMPPGLAVSAGILQTQPREFAASWAFVLEPIDDRRCRLIERFRVRFGELGWLQRLTAGPMGLGVFLMMRKQMLGIRERAEGELLGFDEPAAGGVLAPTPRHDLLVPAG